MRRMESAVVIRPKFAVPNAPLGLPKPTRLKKLKMSARIWKRARPASGKFFDSDRSVMMSPGPRSRLRGALP